MSPDDPDRPEAVYGQRLLFRTDLGVAEYTDVQAGPAGVAAVELPDGLLCEVDHADPASLVMLVAPDDLDRSTLERWIGRRAEPTGGSSDDATAPRFVPRAGPQEFSTGRDRRRPDDPSIPFGRMVLAVDLLDDDALDPLVRLIAGAELLLELDDDPTVEPLVPLRAQVRRAVEHLTTLVDDVDDLASVAPSSLPRAADLLRSLVGRLEPRSLPLEQLSDRLDRASAARWSVAEISAPAPAMRSARLVRDETAAPIAALIAEPAAPPPEDYLHIQRVEPALLRVEVGRAAEGTWVRVLRHDGMVLLAAAPLHDEDLLRTAELIVPPDTPDDELIVQLVDVSDVDRGPSASELLRLAVRAGRDAARTERLGRRGDARRRWTECAELWRRAGDEHRATLAELRADGGLEHPPIMPLVCDELGADLAALNG